MRESLAMATGEDPYVTPLKTVYAHTSSLCLYHICWVWSISPYEYFSFTRYMEYDLTATILAIPIRWYNILMTSKCHDDVTWWLGM